MYLFRTYSVHSWSLQLLYTVVDVQFCANYSIHSDIIIDLRTFFTSFWHTFHNIMLGISEYGYCFNALNKSAGNIGNWTQSTVKEKTF